MTDSLNVLCAVCAFALGTLSAYINLLISRRGLKSDTVSGIMGCNIARLSVDIITLFAVFWVCRHFALPAAVSLISAALGMTVCGGLMLRRLAKTVLKEDEKSGGE